jgi:uncharacterized membrane protein
VRGKRAVNFSIGFEYRMGVLPHLQAIAYRSTSQRTVQFYAKYDDPQESLVDFSEDAFMAELAAVKGYLLELERANKAITRFSRLKPRELPERMLRFT